MYISLFLFILNIFKRFYLFIFRKKEREGERQGERNINVQRETSISDPVAS